ncbi:unnamed protein product [Ilex paraguariensis]|uniref:Uncharacterized protein n=1 Tax=Ilex paraguariensis TaxID=185542 RepID=A0ABC8TS09_9AQUA
MMLVILGARFGFTLDEELIKAAGDDDVKAAIADKISRERIGHEVDLMISGNQPVKAMTYISDLLLFWVVFSLPPTFEPQNSNGSDRLYVAYTDAVWRLMQEIGLSTFSDDEGDFKEVESLEEEARVVKRLGLMQRVTRRNKLIVCLFVVHGVIGVKDWIIFAFLGQVMVITQDVKVVSTFMLDFKMKDGVDWLLSGIYAPNVSRIKWNLG